MSTFYEEGFYYGKVTQQAMTKASTGTPQFVLRFTVLEMTDGNPVPRQYDRSWYRAITEKTMPYFERDLETLGFQGNSLKELDPANGNFCDFTGKTFEFRCKHEQGQNGDMREKWDLALPATGSGAIEGAPVDSAQYRQLDALFNRSRKQNTGGATPAQQTRASRVAEVEQHLTDDDIPF